MKKIMRLGSMFGGMLLTLVMTVPVLAQAKYPPQPPAEPNILRRSEGTGGAGTDLAFTGQDVTLLIVVIGVLLMAGVAALLAARRRTVGVQG